MNAIGTFWKRYIENAREVGRQRRQWMKHHLLHKPAA